MRSVSIVEVAGVALVAGLLALLASAVWRGATGRGRRRVLGPAALDAALVASLVAVVVATLTPLSELGAALDQPSEVNLRPLEMLVGAPEYYARINAVLLAPTIVLLAQRWRRAGVVRLTLVGATLSVAIELLQLVHPQRGTNVDDVLLNTAGAFVAAIVGILVRRARGRHLPRRARSTREPGGGDEGSRRRGLGELDEPVERAGHLSS